MRSTIKIHTNAVAADYMRPWHKCDGETFTGSGFAIEGRYAPADLAQEWRVLVTWLLVRRLERNTRMLALRRKAPFGRACAAWMSDTQVLAQTATRTCTPRAHRNVCAGTRQRDGKDAAGCLLFCARARGLAWHPQRSL